MYAILSEGKLISLCSEPRYVKQNKNGTYIQTVKDDAKEIAVKGKRYSIVESDESDLPYAIITEVDLGNYVISNSNKIEINDALTKESLSSIEDALCDMDTSNLEYQASVENALCEFDSEVTGG